MKTLIKHTGLHMICDDAAERLYTDDQASERPEENCCVCNGHDCQDGKFEWPKDPEDCKHKETTINLTPKVTIQCDGCGSFMTEEWPC